MYHNPGVKDSAVEVPGVVLPHAELIYEAVQRV